MSNKDVRSITNSFQDVRLVSLASWSKAAEIVPRDSHGPYVVLQEGYSPEDITVSPDEFILSRSGKWLSLALFYRLPVAERRAEFVFGTAAEVIQVLGELTSKVALFDAKERPAEEAEEAGVDEWKAAIEKGNTKGSTP